MEILALTLAALLILAAFVLLTMLGMISLLRVDMGVASQVIDALRDQFKRLL